MAWLIGPLWKMFNYLRYRKETFLMIRTWCVIKKHKSTTISLSLGFSRCFRHIFIKFYGYVKIHVITFSHKCLYQNKLFCNYLPLNNICDLSKCVNHKAHPKRRGWRGIPFRTFDKITQNNYDSVSSWATSKWHARSMILHSWLWLDDMVSCDHSWHKVLLSALILSWQ